MNKKVEIYTTPGCHFCHIAKGFFDENSIEYTEYDVSKDVEKRNEMLQKSGQMGVPVIVIRNADTNEENIVVGFNKLHLSGFLDI